MAITKIIKVKANVSRCIDYVTKREKTDQGALITYSYGQKDTIKQNFKSALDVTKKASSSPDAVKAYHLIQSFAKTDNITAEEAHAIGLEMMEKLFEGRYAFVCATHNDKGHLHNHFVVCAAERAMTGRKLHDNLTLLHNLQRTNDELCRAHGLDVIENKKGKGKSYKEWLEDKTNPNGSKKTQLRNLIDEKIRVANDFDDFIDKMKEAGAGISFGTSKKYGRVTKFKLPGAAENDRWNRGYNLGPSYSDDAITRRIINRIHREEEREARRLERAAMSKADKAIDRTKLKINKMIDTSKDEVTSKNIGLERWKNRQNAMRAEQIKETLWDRFGIDYTQIKSHINTLTADNNRLESEIQNDKKHIENLRQIISECKIYADTHKTYIEYENAKDQEKFYQEHDQELNAFFAAEELLTRANINFTGLTDEKYFDKYIKSLQETLKKAEQELSEKEAEIRQNEKDIAELRGYQKELNTYHNHTSHE